MQYLCLRTCFVNDRLWHADETYNLPENMTKNEKNFRSKEVKEAEIKASFICPKCGKELKSRVALMGHSRTHNK